MNKRLFNQSPPLVAAIVIPLLALVLACGPGAEPTPTPTVAVAATPTPAFVATPTPAPAAGPVATPTPTVAPIPSPSATAKRGGVLVTGAVRASAHYDIQVLSSLGDFSNTVPFYTNLFYNPKGDVVLCEICVDEEYQLENAGKTMAFNIKPGIKFHNGQEMTSADVKYSLEKMMGQIDGVVSARCGVLNNYVENIQAPSRYVLRINLVRPSPFVVRALAMGFCVLYPAGTTRAQLQDKPNGSGPFLLKEKLLGSHLMVERNPNFFKPELPYLDGMTVRYASDDDALGAAFLARRLDISGAPRTYRLLFAKFAAQGEIVGVKLPEARFIGVGALVSKPPFDNVKLRQAVGLVLDRSEFGRAILDDEYMATVLFGPETAWGRPESEVWDVVPGWGRGAKKQQEIEQAKRLVVEAGFSAGLDVELMSSTNSLGRTSASDELAGEMLGKIGIRTTIKVVTGAVRDLRLISHEWSLGQAAGTMSTGDPDEFLGGYFVTGGSRNWFFYSSKEIDQLFVQQSSELDPVKRKQLVRQFEDIIVVKDVVTAPLVITYNFTYWYAYVKGYSPGGPARTFGSGVTRKEAVWLDGKGQ